MRIGNRIPPVSFGVLEDNGTVEHISCEGLFTGIKAVVVGVPGAFMPICTHEHLPDFISKAALIKRSGFDQVFCVATSDPYSVSAWSKSVDPTKQLRFLSAGNLAFARACGLIVREEALYLGERSSRYVMTIENALVTRLRVEPSILSVTCTRPTDVVELE